MRTHIIYIAIITLLSVTCYGTCSWGKGQKERADRGEANFAASQQLPGKTTSEFQITRKDFQRLFPVEAHELDSLKSSKRVKTYHAIDWREHIQATIPPDSNPPNSGSLNNYPEPSHFDPASWSFQQKCVEAHFKDSAGMLILNMDLFPSVDIVTDLYIPKWWKFRQLCHPSMWNDSTVVTNGCGWEVTRNVKFNFVKKK